MRYCSNCGTQNDNDAKFCSGCGTKLEGAMEAPVEETVAAVQEEIPAPAPIPVPAPENDFAPQAPQFDQQPQFRAADQAPQMQQPQAPQYQQQPYTPYQSTVPVQQPISAKCRTFGIISFVLGILSLVFVWFFWIPVGGIVFAFLSLAFAIVGLIFSGVSRKAGTFTLAKLGKIFSIIGICLAGVLLIIAIIITVGAFASGDYYFYY